MSTAFAPAGDRARWVMVLDTLREVPVGDTITYQTLAAVLDLSDREDRPILQAATRTAAKHMLETDDRACEAVPNVGYRVVHAPEQLRLARARQKRAELQLRTGAILTTNVDFSEMDPTVRRAFEVFGQALRAQVAFVAQIDIRQRNIEAALGSMRVESQTDADEMRDRLARAEQAIAELRT